MEGMKWEQAHAAVEYVRREYTDKESTSPCFLEIMEALDYVEDIMKYDEVEDCTCQERI